MSIQLYSYGACIRMVTDSSVLMLAKTQVKRIEVIRQDTVKISLGEGTLNEILIKLADVTQPTGLVDVAALRDYITHLLDNANQFEEEALLRQQAQIDQLIEIKQLFNLWHSSLQIDLNFQQLQVNALVAISNRLLEAKENDERLISKVQDQTGELKAQSLQMTAMDLLLTGIKGASENALNKQDLQAGILSDIKGSAGGIQTLLADELSELKAQSVQMIAMDSLLSGIKETVEHSLAKQGEQGIVMADIKNNTGQTQTILSDSLTELKGQTGKLDTLNTTLSDIRTQNTATQTKQDAQTQILGEIKTLLANKHS